MFLKLFFSQANETGARRVVADHVRGLGTLIFTVEIAEKIIRKMLTRGLFLRNFEWGRGSPWRNQEEMSIVAEGGTLIIFEISFENNMSSSSTNEVTDYKKH